MNQTAVIYARVSSTGDRQSTDRQIEDLTRYAEGKGLDVIRIFQEHVSGAKSNREREVLAECQEFCRAERPGTLMVTELSRLGRSTVETERRLELYGSRIRAYVYAVLSALDLPAASLYVIESEGLAVKRDLDSARVSRFQKYLCEALELLGWTVN